MKPDIRKVSLLGAVYASQGISPGFAAIALPVVLRRQGVSLQMVGLSGLLLLPMALKFVWGPWADRVATAGTTRVWITGLWAALALAFAGLAVTPPARWLAPFLVLVAAAYLIVAVLDVVTDGVAVRLLTPIERPLGNAAQYGGYYAGAILGGGLFLALEPRLGWVPAVGLLAAIVAAGWVTARRLLAVSEVALPPDLGSREPVEAGGRPEARASLLAFLRGPVARRVLPLLLLLDLPQNVGIALVGPFLLDLGLSQAQVGLVSGSAGLLAALAGAVLGGMLLTRLPRTRALVIAGVLQAAPLFGFAALATAHASALPSALLVVCTAYGFASAFNIALSSWFMDHVSPRQPATDYSIMACAHTGTFVIAGPIAGWCAAKLGFASYYLVSAAAALVLLLVALPWLRRPLASGGPAGGTATAGDAA